jgi:hypothetical protein
VDDQTIEKISQQLISALLVVGMILLAKNRTQFGGRDLEINQCKNFDDVIVLQLQGNSQLFQNIIVCHAPKIQFLRLFIRSGYWLFAKSYWL